MCSHKSVQYGCVFITFRGKHDVIFGDIETSCSYIFIAVFQVLKRAFIHVLCT